MNDLPSGPTRLGARVAPLSFAQERLWFIDAAAPGSATYNVPLLLSWRGTVDPATLTAALKAVVDRHEVLRTTYHLRDGALVQEIGDTGEPAVEVVDLSGVDGARDRARAEAADLARRGFDLADRPPLRCAVWRGVPGGDLVLLVVHHIAVDGWSLPSLFADLAAAYDAVEAGEPAALPEPPVQYADFAVWDRAVTDSPAMEKLLADRAEQLNEVPGDLVLGPARPRAAVADGDRPGEEHVFAIPAELWTGVRDLARTLRATPFVVLFAAYQAVLQRWSGRDDFLVGTVTANRPHASVEQLVGFFVNTVPLRCRPEPDLAFAELCKRVRTEAFQSLTHQRIPFDRLTTRTSRGTATIGFALQNMPAPGADGRWTGPELLPTGTAKFDLILIVEEERGGPRGRIEFDTDVYPAEVAARLAGNFLTLLTAAVRDPGTTVARLPLGAAREGVLVGADQDLDGAVSVLDLVGRGFTDLGASAVSAAGDRVSWRELDAWSRAVAHHLADRGAGPAAFVPVLAARGPALVAGWLGALRTGAAYAPLSLDTPADRLDHVLAELDARVVLVDHAGAALLAAHGTRVDAVRIEDLRAARDLPAPTPAAPTLPGSTPPESTPTAPTPTAPTLPDPVLTGREPAVVIYTSGTTGRPKGVLVPHGGMLNTAVWWARDIDLGPADRVLCTWSTSFDGATHEVFRSLIAGSELVFADDVERRDPTALARLLRGVTVTSMTPSLLRAVLDADDDPAPTALRTLYVGGEGLPTALARECLDRWGVPMRNIYGPTEASCISTFAPVDLADGRAPAIGVPLPRTRAYVLGAHREELPVGVPGELYVAGAGVALGYLGQPERTGAAFLPDPHGEGPDARMYRTGDRVVLREDGLVECLGRVDDQVKVLGNRIELGEVRKLLEERPEVRAAAVQAEGEPLRLVAWIELAEPDAPLPTRDEVLKPLLRWLPAAVLPAEVHVVDALPMTANDKTDFAALGALRSVRLPYATAPAGELTPDQERAARLFADALGRDVAEFGADADFFTRGGHSLLAVKMLAGTRAALRDFLADPTVAGLAALLTAPEPEAVAAPAADDRFPVTAVQQRFWFMDKVSALRSAYLAPVLTEFTGRVDLDALRRAVELVLGRHPALRSRFALDAKQRKVFYRTDGAPPEVVVTDAAGWSADEVADHLADACWTPFDLAVDAPARAEVVALDDRAVLVLTAHHIVTDGWSQQVLAEQIAAVYRGRDDLADPVHPAALAGEPVDEARVAEVVAALRGAPTDVDLPRDRPRPTVQSTGGRTTTALLDREVTAALRAAGAELGCTTFMTTAALLAVALARRGDQRDFLFAFPWAGRDRAGSADAVGMFINTLVLRVDLRDEPTWRELLVRVRDRSTACYRDADVPFDAIAAALHPGRDLSRPPVTPVYTTALPAPAEPPDLGPGTTARYLPPEPTHIKYEFELVATDLPDRVELAASCATGLFDAGTAAGLLASVTAAASDLAVDLDAPALKEIRK
ncbi:amino acid adenylation domain-containing protein [Saccharothrix lopnurensis]|uniref:Amino acid adenylation domain-containing protein n=1 Tax=Saccharothrix lopnurensis TaxID=1670621 RepID=A0ABW1PAB0_9PSEU